MATLGWLPISSCSTYDGGPQDCTDVGCSDGAHLEVFLDEIVAGEYSLKLDLEGAEHACLFVLPDERTDANLRESVDCTPQLWNATIWGPCEGNSCGEREPMFTVIAPGTPKHISIRIERDGELVLAQSRSLEYTRQYPNGRACGPVCSQSSASFGP